MPRSRPFIPGASYDICSKGNNRQTIFHNPNDYQTYLSQLRHDKRKFHLTIQAYCLMPNHIHVLVPANSLEDLAKAFQSFHRAHTEHFRKKYEFAGHLWKGRFRSGPISSEKGLLDCINDIEQNSVRAGMVETSADHLYSSAHERKNWGDAAQDRGQTGILDIY